MKKNLTLRRNQEEKNKAQLTLSEQNFKIYLRIKPNTNSQSNKDILKPYSSNKVQIHSPYHSAYESAKQYSYDEVFNSTANNTQIFQSTLLSPIKNALQGYNSTVLIYGMTGAGKTYTMFGNIGNTTSKGIKSEQEGIVSMTVDTLFEEIEKNLQIKTQVYVSFFEIYNETIKDLLNDQQKLYQIMEDPVNGFVINDITIVSLEDRNQTKDIIFSGLERRAMNATKSNQVSSRSHAILQFSIKRFIDSSATQNTVMESKLFMVDLAGNEKTSSHESKRFIEGVNINKSLLTLGKCLNILAEKKNGFIPFRDSKLTRILKESLGGNSKTVMIACASSESRYYQETLNTLKYSSIARKIKNKGIKHNLKIISKDQVPSNKQFPIVIRPNIHCESQYNVKSTLSELIMVIEQKSKIERIQEELEENRQENYNMINSNPDEYQLWAGNIKKIDLTLANLMKAYQRNIAKAENFYQILMKSISSNINNKQCEQSNLQNQKREIERLNEIISMKNQRIRQLEQNSNFMSSQQHEIVQPDTFSYLDTIRIQENLPQSIRNHHESQFVYNKQNQNNLVQPKRKRLIIESSDTPKNITRRPSRDALQVISLNNSGINHIQPVNSQRNNLNRYFQPPYQKQITITLTEKTPQNKFNYDKEQFIRRLKQTEKKPKLSDNSVIGSLIDEQDANRYELSNTELSMLRKLKFIHRENRIVNRSSSLKHTLNRSNSNISQYSHHGNKLLHRK